ncbi:MAG: pyridoxamine 5'-phosphate oxidase family protein [Chloroflexi bacterium]|nr:MAG: pyridoxamine 5'-phosphate oxidase family protein [Chloroflexota bacterium]
MAMAKAMVSWAEFAAAAPDMAAQGRRLIHPRDHGEAFLATVRGEGALRIHPISVGIVDDGLFAFIIKKSAKHADLMTDGRYALHSHVDPAAPSEFSVRGRAELASRETRDAVAPGWSFDVDDDYDLFEFGVEHAVLGVRDDPDEWPPRYTSWASGRRG